jgi:hypothetical protein
MAPCLAGRYCLAGSNSSQGTGPCNAGYYCDSGSSTANGLGTCNAGYYCLAGSNSQNMAPCLAGRYCLAGAATTQGSGPCIAGSFSTGSAKFPPCTACPPGSYNAPGQPDPCITSALLKLQNISVSDWKNQSNTPSTGSAVALITGRQLGSTTFSSAYRFTGSALEFTRWLSDSCIRIRLNAGVPIFSTSLILSLPGLTAAAKGSLVSVLMYNLPHPLIVSSQRLSGISVIGSSFGTYLAVVPRTWGCSAALLQPNTDSAVCSSSDLDTREAGVTVAEAAVSFAFSDPSRLDNVIVSLMSPSGRQFKLMQNKCFGAPPCSGGVAFRFQILPIVQLPGVPLQVCPSSGQYLPDDVNSLRLELLSPSARGTWALRVASGTQILNVSSASFFFKTAILDARFVNASTVGVTSLEWFSDSSLSMKAPGYQNASGTESSSGWGRNHTVAVFSSGIQSPFSCTYSYPDPVVAETNSGAAYSSSGSFKLQLLGRYFSNANSDPRVRTGYSACAATRWSSDTAVSCTQVPSLGQMRALVLTLERSALANFNMNSNFFHEQVVSSSSAHALSATAASSVTLFGAGFGVRSDTPRLRVWDVLSSAVASKWLCDTLVLTKVAFSNLNTPGLTISIALVTHDFTALKFPELWPPNITACRSFNFPTTGAAVLQLTGSAFGLRMASMKTSIGGSFCLESRWISDSSVYCKTAAGLQLPFLTIAATSSRLWSNRSSGVYPSIDSPVVNGSARVISENADVCFFNSSGCETGRLIQLVQSASGFGTCLFPQRQLNVVQGGQSRNCDATSWVSDSSMHCLFNAPVSPEFPGLQAAVVYEGFSSSQMHVQNPFYKPASPSLSKETVQLRYYQNPTFPTGEDNGFRQFGTTSGFEWPNSSFISNVHYSEVITFTFLLYISSSQFFLDSKFAPIETNVSGSVMIWNASDVTSTVLCDQSTSKNVAFALLPQTFWTKVTISLVFCAPKHLNMHSLRLRAVVSVRNLNRTLPLEAFSPAFLVASSGSASVNITTQPSHPIISASKIYNDSLGFRFFFGTSLDDTCQQGGVGLFKFSVRLLCGGQTASFRSPLPSNGEFIESTQCLLNIIGISFIRPAKGCHFNVSVLADGIVSCTSQAFDVIPGLAKIAMLVGAGPFCASAGAIVWSVNSTSDGVCLVVQLQDTEGNNITAAVEATVIARNVNDSQPMYHIARSASNMSSASGLIRWCDAYSSKAQNVGIVIGARVNGYITYWSSSVINVSSNGPAFILLPITDDVKNQTLLPGAAPQKFSFSIQDAGGNNLARSATVAIRVRIVPRLNSVAYMAASLSKGKRRLLQASNSSADACALDNSLEFTFVLNSGSSQITAGPDFLCVAGDNIVYYDVGTLDSSGIFIPTTLAAFSQTVTVLRGSPSGFSLSCPLQIPEKSFTSMQSFVIVVAMDLGWNVNH